MRGWCALSLRGDPGSMYLHSCELSPSDPGNEKKLRGNESCSIGSREDGKRSFLLLFLSY